MSCCGKGRLQAVGGRERAPSTALRAVVEYTGTTSMVVISPTTGRRYQFSGPGARLEIDPRDRPYLMGIPHLRALA
jgi:hypothetical protein